MVDEARHGTGLVALILHDQRPGVAGRRGFLVRFHDAPLHFDPQAWGSQPHVFKPNRFRENAKDSKSQSYRPWGGGQTLCPGRVFARRSINAFVALLLSRYDITVDPTHFPVADGAKPSPGVILVAQGEDVILKCLTRSGQ